jgi:hypothetical protein
MAWSESEWFAILWLNLGGNTTAIDLDADGYNASLWGNSITPDSTVSAANSAYGAGQWTAGANEASDGAEWAVAGRALDTVTWTQSSDTLTFDAADEASGSSATLTAFGTHIHNTTITTPVDNQGICYNYFGGQAQVTDATLTLVFNSSGIGSVAV